MRLGISWLTISALAVGVALLVVSGYVQFKSDHADAGRQDTDGTPISVTQRPGMPSTTPGRRSPSGYQQAPPKSAGQETPPAEARSTASPRPADPVTVSVPKLEVTARVLAIRARDGSLIPPSDPRLVGWWSDGARPGAGTGSAIITGHTVHTGGGAFNDLDQLTTGDRVVVASRSGTIRYVVSSVATYRKKTLAAQSQRVFSQTVPGRLVLVTCEDWDGTDYLSNTVVIAAPVR
jgi:LPXTG-site transpeptidase (sortase) family protein